MKFGKRIQHLETPEWRAKFLDYVELKKMLKVAKHATLHEKQQDKLLEQQQQSNWEAPFDTILMPLQMPQLSSAFLRKMVQQVNKVNAFFVEQEREFGNRQGALNQQIEIFRTSIQGRYFKRDQVKKLKRTFKEHYRGLMLLLNYRSLNFLGFSKILKKFDKVSGNQICHTVVKQLKREHFYASQMLKQMITQTEYLATMYLYDGSRKNAMEKLRIPSHQEGKHKNRFRGGFWLGVGAVMSIVWIYLYAVHYRSMEMMPSYSQNVFFIYRVLLFPIILGVFIALNLRIWSKAYINYVLIFGLSQRHHITKWSFLKAFLVLYALWSTSFILYLWLEYFDYLSWFTIADLGWINPIVLVAILLLVLVCPFRCFYRSSRFWLLRICLKICVCIFFPVKFADFWIADQLMSLSDFLFQVQFVFCLATPFLADNAFCTSAIRIGVPILNIVPPGIRLLQCIRRYYDSRQKIHLVNGLKYVFSGASVVAIFVDRLLSNRTTNVMTNAHVLANVNFGFSAWRISWIVIKFASTVFSLVWDLIMDWGLMKRRNVDAGVMFPFLRRDLLFHPVWYYLAIVCNCILRFAWVLSFGLYFAWGATFASEWAVFIFAFVEIFRRFVWNVFRLEHEHINNTIAEYELPFGPQPKPTWMHTMISKLQSWLPFRASETFVKTEEELKADLNEKETSENAELSQIHNEAHISTPSGDLSSIVITEVNNT